MDLQRKTAFLTLLAVEKDRAYSNIELNRRIGEIRPDNPGFVRDLVYGVLERKLTLDHYLGQLLEKGTKGLDIRALCILRMGVYQMDYMDSVPDHAAVDECVKLADKYCRYLKGLVNGVLRNYIRQRDSLKTPEEIDDMVTRTSVKYSADPSIVDLLFSQYGEEKTETILAASNERPPLTIRANLLRTGTAELAEILEEEGFRVSRSSLSKRGIRVEGQEVMSSSAYRDGLFSVQDESSMVMIDDLGPEPDQTVIDVCAAPGGKSFASAEIMENKGLVMGMDIYEKKVALMDERASQLGIRIFRAARHDARKTDTDLMDKADIVICDVPCSGLGVMRRRPEIKYFRKMDDLRSLEETQKIILESSSGYVKKGGRLAYSTCTININENERQVKVFLSSHPEFVIQEEKLFLPGSDDTDGFYYCVMKRS